MQLRIANRPALLLLALALAACATPKQAQTPEEQAYLDAAMAHSTTFTLPADEASGAWARAHVWIENHATMGMEIASEEVIKTFDPPTTSTTTTRYEYGYNVTQHTSGANVTFMVEGSGNDPSLDIQARQNAHLLAYYMATGKTTPTGLVDR